MNDERLTVYYFLHNVIWEDEIVVTLHLTREDVLKEMKRVAHAFCDEWGYKPRNDDMKLISDVVIDVDNDITLIEEVIRSWRDEIGGYSGYIFETHYTSFPSIPDQSNQQNESE